MLQTLNYNAEYASEVLKSIPVGYIDKTVCGCGLTTVALENTDNVIIAVPSVELIRNKTVQYPNNRSSNKVLGVYGSESVNIDEYTAAITPVKIMVTYDSLSKVSYLLDRPDFKLIIDESNKLLSSSRLKSTSKKNNGIDVVTKVFQIAEKYKYKTSFISATPIPLDYLPSWVSEIPQIKIEWKDTVKAQPILMKRTFPYRSLVDEIVQPLSIQNSITIAGNTFSKAIVFINNVTTIVQTIKKANINKKDVAIVAGDTVKNDLKIKGYNRLKDPSNLPKFTFITSTGFEGIDLIDDSAISIVVSNTGASYQMIDVMTDLKQAISRQRNKLNPNYGKFIYLYNNSVFDTSKEELLQQLKDKRKELENVIALWRLAKREGNQAGFLSAIKSNQEFKTYVNYFEDEEEFKMNDNLFNSDKYFILNTREQYKRGFDIKSISTFENSQVVSNPFLVEAVSYVDMIEIYKKRNLLKDLEEYKYKTEYYNLIEQCVKLYNKVWSNYTYAVNMVENYSDDYSKLKLILSESFSLDSKYSNKEVKVKLQEIYNQQEINRKAKATDLAEFFIVKNIYINKQRGIQIISEL